jgi:hypothetical protein
MVPVSVLKRHGKDIQNTVIQGFPAGRRIHFLRVAGAGADDRMRVMAGVDHNAFDVIER